MLLSRRWNKSFASWLTTSTARDGTAGRRCLCFLGRLDRNVSLCQPKQRFNAKNDVLERKSLPSYYYHHHHHHHRRRRRRRQLRTVRQANGRRDEPAASSSFVVDWLTCLCERQTKQLVHDSFLSIALQCKAPRRFDFVARRSDHDHDRARFFIFLPGWLVPPLHSHRERPLVFPRRPLSLLPDSAPSRASNGNSVALCPLTVRRRRGVGGRVFDSSGGCFFVVPGNGRSFGFVVSSDN